ncbi:MAG TPA: hypothetical protein VKT77_09175, partial [Chthonomonadaceae bacterium]|nr:hypothetical protein [Chthonomonadaceae bacterium]
SRYARRKPIMVCEFAATHFSEVEGRPRPDFAIRKISTLYMALARAYPRVKCINYFDGNALRYTGGAASNNYCVTDDSSIMEVYRYLVSAPYFLSAPAAAGAAPPMAPMPFRNGETLQGRVRLSCFARAPADIVSARYYVDGTLIYEARDPVHWDCLWNAGSAPPGRHTLVLKVYDGRRRLVARQSATFSVSPPARPAATPNAAARTAGASRPAGNR